MDINILGIMFLAILLEGTLAFLLGKSDTYTGPREWIKYVALLGGIILAVAYQVDIPSMLGLSSPILLVNYVISGIVIGRGSNYVNDIVTSLTKPKI